MHELTVIFIAGAVAIMAFAVVRHPAQTNTCERIPTFIENVGPMKKMQESQS